MRKDIALLLILLGTGVVVQAQIKNTKLDEWTQDDRDNEPAIAINLRNPKNIVSASGAGNVYISSDGGLTWQKSKLTSPLGMYGEPVLVADGKGDMYYFHLSDPTGEGWKNEKSLDQIVCHVSGDGGKTWDEGNAIGYNPPKDQHKPSAAVDDKENVYVTWTQFDRYNSADSNCLSSIMMSQSPNGKKWSKPVEISQTPGGCADDDNTAAGALPVLNADGKMFITWANKNMIFLDRSFEGNRFLTNDIAVARQPGGWKMDVPGYAHCNGLPVMVTDKSKGKFRGMLFLVMADQRNGENDTDIWFMRSNNYGDNWSSPEHVNSDHSGRHQYLPRMAIDQSTGFLYILYYDRRNYDDNQTDVYLAYSIDGGFSFKDVKISESPFTPTDAVFLGANIAAYKGIITPVWTRTDNGKVSIWTSLIRHEDLVKMK